MGLIHTNHYLDFSSDDWKQISSNPTVFEAIVDNAVIELRDTGHKEQKIVFKNGGQIKYIRSIGKYRLSWDDEDLVSQFYATNLNSAPFFNSPWDTDIV